MLDVKERTTRPHSSADYLALKTATKLAAELAGQSLGCVAKRTRLDAGTISRAGNPRENNFLPLDVALDLDTMTGDHTILRTYARLLGFDLVPLHSAAIVSGLSVKAGYAAREGGEMVAKILESAADGQVTPREAREVLKEADELELVTSAIKHDMHGVIAAGK